MIIEPGKIDDFLEVPLLGGGGVKCKIRTWQACKIFISV
jgi:hypothetical protein